MAALVEALASAGEHDRARTLAHETETIARSITDPYYQAQVLAALVEALASAGEHDRARTLAHETETIAR
ncbi:hypothetical protein ABZV14_01930, partial [Streptosporangium canum]|uniref:hypothetical protein n=1 Tax=Streptosporangium canum TaxID=324952 RepID=UPI0033BC88D2